MNPAAMTERLIDAAIYNEEASGGYKAGARKELNDARAAIESALDEAMAALREKEERVKALKKERDIHNGHRRMAEAKLMALQSGAVLEGRVLVPVEPTDEMLAATCDQNGHMRLMEFTSPDERSKPFLMPRFAYRAMVKAARSLSSVQPVSGSREQRGNEEG